MAIIDVSNKSFIDEGNVGAIICHTPKTLSNSCTIVKSIDDLIKNFGDPFINPTVYSELVLAYDLVKHGIPLYISSIHDMKINDDEFTNILYNGYTEFTFLESSINGSNVEHLDSVGYKLKSDIKFCQPIIKSMNLSDDGNKLHLFVQLYYLDRQETRSIENNNLLYSSYLFKTIEFTYNVDSLTDSILVSDFSKNGLELKPTFNFAGDRALTDKLISCAYSGLDVLFRSTIDSTPDTVKTSDYWYNLHSEDYSYDFDTEFKIVSSYYNAIDLAKSTDQEPLMLCLGRLFKSKNEYTEEILNAGTENEIVKNILISSKLENLDPDTHISVCNYLLDIFNEECNTYLFINSPDLSVSSTIRLLSNTLQYANSPSLLNHFNCDLFFGYATDYINDATINHNSRKVYYSSALLSFYNMMLSNKTYMTNNFLGLNIANKSVKIILSESSALKLRDLHCNSMVLFDTGTPSIYGDTSLSKSANLKYSHVSRNFVRIRRLIHNYLERQKFIVNTLFNVERCISYISNTLLNDFRSLGILSDYTVSYTNSVDYKTVNITINLLFKSIADVITLDFTI